MRAAIIRTGIMSMLAFAVSTAVAVAGPANVPQSGSWSWRSGQGGDSGGHGGQSGQGNDSGHNGWQPGQGNNSGQNGGHSGEGGDAGHGGDSGHNGSHSGEGGDSGHGGSPNEHGGSDGNDGGCNNPPSQVPITDGLPFLAIAGTVYGAFELNKHRSRSKNK